MALEGKKVNESDLPFHASASHIQHCIDLLRNALMCQPDLTVEVKNDELDGVTGFGTEHQCVDWKGLVSWTSEWETFQQESLPDNGDKMMERPGHGHDHGLKE